MHRAGWMLGLMALVPLMVAGCGRRAGQADENAARERAEDLAAAKDLVTQGQAHLKKHEWDAALDCFERAIIRNDKNPEALYGRGRVRYEFAQPTEKTLMLNQTLLEQAIADFTAAVELDPQLQKAFARRGEARLLRGLAQSLDTSKAEDSRKDLDDALVDLNRALELDPRDPWALIARGRVHQRFGEFSDALSDFEAALNLNSSLTEARKYRDACKQELGEQPETGLPELHNDAASSEGPQAPSAEPGTDPPTGG